MCGEWNQGLLFILFLFWLKHLGGQGRATESDKGLRETSPRKGQVQALALRPPPQIINLLLYLHVCFSFSMIF